MPHAIGLVRIELVVEQRARAIEERLRIGDAIAQRLHQPRGAAERIAQHRIGDCRRRGRGGAAALSAEARRALRQRASRSAGRAARARSRRRCQSRAACRRSRQTSCRFAQPASPMPNAHAHSAGSLRLGVEAVDDARLRGARRQDDDVVLRVEIAGEVLRLHHLVIDAALLEHPHLPAGRHVAGGLVEADLGVRLQALAVDRRRAIDAGDRDAELLAVPSRRSAATPRSTESPTCRARDLARTPSTRDTPARSPSAAARPS